MRGAKMSGRKVFTQSSMQADKTGNQDERRQSCREGDRKAYCRKGGIERKWETAF
jgi:hypothetical protein